MDIINRAEDFITAFYHAYYRKNYEYVIVMLSEDAIWSETQMERAIVGKQQLTEFLTKRYQTLSIYQFEIQGLQTDVQTAGASDYLVTARYRLQIQKDGRADRILPFYSSVLLEKEDFKIRQVLFSPQPDELKKTDSEISLGRETDMRIKTGGSDSRLEWVNERIRTLYNSVPGGIFQCFFDDKLTLREMSDGFLSMIGYTRQEVHDKLDDSLRVLIHPDDYQQAIKDVQEQLAKGNTKEIQYRLRCKDGHCISVLDKGTFLTDEEGRECFYCIVVDVTKTKEMEEELRLSLGRYQIITDQTNDVIFEWDIENDSLAVSNNWEKKFGIRNFSNGCSLYSILTDYKKNPFSREDMELIRECIQQIKDGKPYIETEIRIRNESGRYIWCRIRMTQQFDQKGMPIKVIGVLIDIDRERRQSISLKKKAEQDALTGMYNKIATQTMISEYLHNSPDRSALMIIDIDNFKMVNDTMGHLYGDAVLSNLAREMSGAFRDTDILGRIGGDEFIIFLKSVKDVELICQNARRVLDLFTQLNVNGHLMSEISCSIGIALFPDHGRDFTTLYQNADYALYQAKHEGKNRYFIYDEGGISNYIRNRKHLISSVGSKIDSNQDVRVMNADLVEYAFRILYNSKDMNAAISNILEIIGNHFDVSRAYIYECSEDEQNFDNTFEWCNKGVASLAEAHRKLPHDRDRDIFCRTYFNEDNLFYCSDITTLPEEHYKVLENTGIKSVLQSAITENGKYRGLVGFDDCRQNRYWTREQVDVLVLISEIISTFLLKYRAVERYRKENEGLLSVLDNQNSWIYVIEPDTKKMLFVNKKTKQIAPDAKTGMYCYKEFLNRETPCERCPADHIQPGCCNCTFETENPYLGIWFNADASVITWKGNTAVLVCCHDITELKRNAGNSRE